MGSTKEAQEAPPRGMQWIPGGTFLMGSDAHYPEEAPAHRVSVDTGFWIDQHAVTNQEFARFVTATRYVTLAERVPDRADYPGAREELLVAASVVFQQPKHRVSLDNPYNWWTYVPGANWRQPQGPGSSVKRLNDHPVAVQVAWEDVSAYADWVDKELPTEAEWEFAEARGGMEGATYAWGGELNPDGRWMANTWQGDFPMHNTREDGHAGTAPVGSYPLNGYGLADMIGNVWEWTTDWFGPHAERAAGAHACCGIENPRGGAEGGRYQSGHRQHRDPSPRDERWLTPLRTQLLPTLRRLRESRTPSTPLLPTWAFAASADGLGRPTEGTT